MAPICQKSEIGLEIGQARHLIVYDMPVHVK